MRVPFSDSQYQAGYLEALRGSPKRGVKFPEYYQGYADAKAGKSSVVLKRYQAEADAGLRLLMFIAFFLMVAGSVALVGLLFSAQASFIVLAAESLAAGIAMWSLTRQNIRVIRGQIKEDADG